MKQELVGAPTAPEKAETVGPAMGAYRQNEGRRRGARRQWFGLALFGSLMIGSAIAYSVWESVGANSLTLWAVIGPLAGVAVVARAGRRNDAIGEVVAVVVLAVALALSAATLDRGASVVFATVGLLLLSGAMALMVVDDRWSSDRSGAG